MFGFFKKVHSALSQKIRTLFSHKLDDAAFDHLEQIFFEADLGASTSSDLVDKIRRLYRKNPDLTPEQTLAFVKAELLLHLQQNAQPLHSPHIILIVGVNGSGKTTSVAKLAFHYIQAGKKVLIAAADTFRAAAIEQLETWASRVGASFLKSQPNSDPSSVAFDAISAAKARGIDIVLIDTAGRLQTKTDLMQELSKVRKVCQKQIPDSPHETLLVLDATLGQNSLDQATTFHKFTPVTGIVLTKLDGSAKGGIAIAIQKELKIPVRWIGTGEQIEDWSPFDPADYLDGLLSLRD